MVQVEVEVGLFNDYFETVLIDDKLHDDPIGIAEALIKAEFETDKVSANVIYTANSPKKLREIQRGVWY